MNRDMNDILHNFEDDAQLNALLDEVLAPEAIEGGIPAGLDARILAAMPLAASHSSEASPVIARIGFFRSATFKRIAAAIVVAAGVGIAIVGSGVFNNNTVLPPVVINPDKPAINSELELAINTAAHPAADTFHLPDGAVDTKLDQLREADLATAINNWNTVADTLEKELDAMDKGEPDNG